MIISALSYAADEGGINRGILFCKAEIVYYLIHAYITLWCSFFIEFTTIFTSCAKRLENSPKIQACTRVSIRGYTIMHTAASWWCIGPSLHSVLACRVPTLYIYTGCLRSMLMVRPWNVCTHSVYCCSLLLLLFVKIGRTKTRSEVCLYHTRNCANICLLSLIKSHLAYTILPSASI